MTKFSKIYTPIVIVIAILIAIVPFVFKLDTKEWILKALIFLVASCPCSLVISVPLSFFTALGKISKKGMIIKGNYPSELLNILGIKFKFAVGLCTSAVVTANADVRVNLNEKFLSELKYELREL